MLRIDGDGVRYEADPRHAEILAAMLGSGAKPVSTPGLRESLGPLAKEEQAERTEDAKVFSLDEAWDDLGASWSPEEEEERCEEEAVGTAGRVRPGRRERAAARGEEAVLGEEGSDQPLDAAETALFRATAARAN